MYEIFFTFPLFYTKLRAEMAFGPKGFTASRVDARVEYFEFTNIRFP